jgi:hypothetical protein
MINDPRVTAFGDGYEVTTRRGVYRVLNAGVMGWGVYQGPNLDMVFDQGGPVIGAADGDELVKALLEQDTSTDSGGADCR